MEATIDDTQAVPMADLESHRIEGFASATGAYFSVPLYSQIEGNLWMGGSPATADIAPDFDTIICLYPWEQYPIRNGAVLTQVYMYDEPTGPDAKLVDMLAAYANAACERGRTLVHCQAGLNRSGLITARALMLRGLSATDAIALLRKRRGEAVLCNAVFAGWLMDRT